MREHQSSDSQKDRNAEHIIHVPRCIHLTHWPLLLLCYPVLFGLLSGLTPLSEIATVRSLDDRYPSREQSLNTLLSVYGAVLGTTAILSSDAILPRVLLLHGSL